MAKYTLTSSTRGRISAGHPPENVISKKVYMARVKLPYVFNSISRTSLLCVESTIKPRQASHKINDAIIMHTKSIIIDQNRADRLARKTSTIPRLSSTELTHVLNTAHDI